MHCVRMLVVGLVVGVAPVAAAEKTPRQGAAAVLEDPDTAAAKRHFMRGMTFYDQQQYAEALVEFEEARRLRPLPALDYNVGRAYERLERWKDAANEYERYLAKDPNGPSSAELRDRIAVLRARGAPVVVAPVAVVAPPQPSRTYRNAAIGVAVGAVVLAAIGTGVYLSAWSAYTSRRDACMGQCDPASLDGLRSQVNGAVAGGAVLWSLAIAAAGVDVALFVVDQRHRRRSSVYARGASLGVSF